MAKPRKTADTLFLAGEVHALITFAQVLAKMHPQPHRLLAEFQAAEQVGRANVDNHFAGEKLALGYWAAIERIRRALEAATESSPKPDID